MTRWFIIREYQRSQLDPPEFEVELPVIETIKPDEEIIAVFHTLYDLRTDAEYFLAKGIA